MSLNAKTGLGSGSTVVNLNSARDLDAIVNDVAPQVAARAAEHDQRGMFVSDAYDLLREAGLVEAGVPAELGGRGASVSELADMLRRLAQACGSTALAFAMHTHQVAIPAWRWRYQKVAAVEPLLKRVASERIILLSSGGSDWIGGSGKAMKVEGGYRIFARKAFTSGAEAGAILMTGAIVEGTDTVIHFGVPMKAPEVRIEPTWDVLGMRATGSNDVVIDNLFIADAAVAFSRKAGEWHPVFQIIATIAFPLIYAVYLGVAEQARELALAQVRQKAVTPTLRDLAGRMDTSLRAAQLAHRWMLDVVDRNAPSAETVNEVMIGRHLVAEHAIRTVELAMELAGGSAFYRRVGIERCFRDVQGARYHPLQAGAQAQYAGAFALGEDVATIW